MPSSFDADADESIDDGEIPDQELAAIAQHGGSFDWLADEPELYSDEDREPV